MSGTNIVVEYQKRVNHCSYELVNLLKAFVILYAKVCKKSSTLFENFIKKGIKDPIRTLNYAE